MLRAFLCRAKRVVYSAGYAPDAAACREGARDVSYQEADAGMRYLCSQLGAEGFVGEEAVWLDGQPIWALNYCGRVTGEGFDEAFLREALCSTPEEAPIRGPIEYQRGSFLYVNTLAGDQSWFFGREEIYRDGVSIFECIYHGGAIR